MKLTDFVEVVKIEKGWSHEQKYKVTNVDGKSFLLRITPIEQYEYKKAEFENMQMISKMGIPMCQPIEFGTCDEGVYSLQSWEFWDLLALYISSNALSSLPWAIPYGQDEIDVMIKLADDILDWYDGMKNTVPKWYSK